MMMMIESQISALDGSALKRTALAGEKLNRSSLLAAGVLLILVFLWMGPAASEEEPRFAVCSSSASVTITGNVVATKPPVTPVTNPAATFCVGKGYDYEIRTDPVSGDQTGYCIFPDESECEEWSFFRGSCTFTPTAPTPPSAPPEEPPAGPPTEEDEADHQPQPSDATALEKILDQIAPLLEKEAAGSLTPQEAQALSARKLELLDAEVAILEADAAAVAARRSLLEIESVRLALEEERLALALEAKGIERRALLALPKEGDASRLAGIKLLLLVIDLKQESLEIEERALRGSPREEDAPRLSELSLAIAYLEAEAASGPPAPPSAPGS